MGRHPQGAGRGLTWAVAAAGGLLLAWQAAQAWQEAAAMLRERDGLQQLQASLAAAGDVMSAQDAQRHAAIARVAECLAVPWGALLDGLEAQTPRGVRLTRWIADAAQGSVIMEGLAESAAARDAFHAALSHTALTFADPTNDPTTDFHWRADWRMTACRPTAAGEGP